MNGVVHMLIDDFSISDLSMRQVVACSTTQITDRWHKTSAYSEVTCQRCLRVTWPGF